MGQRRNRELIMLAILITIFLIAAVTLSRYRESQGNDYAVLGKGPLGYSVIYEALNKLKFNADVKNIGLNVEAPSNLMAVTESFNINRNDEDMKEWVKSGGNLLFLTTLENYDLPYGSLKLRKSNDLRAYNYGSGKIIIANAKSFTNKELVKDTAPAYSIIETLLDMGYDKVSFNEYYIYGADNEKSLWADVPFDIKLVIYQCILVLILFILYKGKRFGKVVTYYEEVERTENEYIYSAASLYRKAKCYDVVFENHLKKLLYEMKKEFRLYRDINYETWVEVWEKENLPELEKAKEIDNITRKNNSRGKYKEYMLIISNFDTLTDIIKRRREVNWKKLQTKE